VLLIAQVADNYTVIRATEEQLRIAHENVALQRRSFEIAEILFREGADSELDMQQARTLLLSTMASIPGLELTLQQARNALNTLLGRPPGELETLLGKPRGIPAVPPEVAVGIPADLLRRRPDVRAAELLAAAQSARIGLAQADLYPSFTLSGSVGLAAASGTNTTRTGDSGVDELLSSDSLTFSAGPAFTWNLLNYGRIKNNVRVQDARLQQLLVSYEDTVLRGAQEVEDALVAFVRGQEQDRILEETVDAARRTVELSTLRYREGLSDYQRVLDAQQSLFAQETRYVANQGNVIRSLVSMYRGLGGGWQIREGREFVDEETRTSMGERTDWGELLQPGAAEPPEVGNEDQRRKPDW
jgi:NodT family efflux transporter outer membrane factor (OMF) lipoprotein